MLSALPAAEDLAFLHSGLAQTCLPHSRPADDRGVWRRQSGRFSLLVQPGVIDDGRGVRHVGVPYGSRARLIMLHLQSEGLKSRTVSLGPTLSAFLRSLGLPVSGGPRGSIVAIREQSMRIARSSGARRVALTPCPAAASSSSSGYQAGRCECRTSETVSCEAPVPPTVHAVKHNRNTAVISSCVKAKPRGEGGAPMLAIPRPGGAAAMAAKTCAD